MKKVSLLWVTCVFRGKDEEREEDGGSETSAFDRRADEAVGVKSQRSMVGTAKKDLPRIDGVKAVRDQLASYRWKKN
ncbi:hypothetical protein EL26_06480 [Tumebacillus flagellatus]|uniref:Uncharacterized protein n=1 Tax=Tumebacillus flagellatus TaxID=1157490 RepID=A0A074LPS5_9BACL|nr:hypothetical protein EL26_06480 [Tumebacillus flagellatus]